jgi:hypothetical protein
MRRKWVSRSAEKQAIERHIALNGVTRPEWTPYNKMPWTLSDQINWIAKNDPSYTPTLARRPRKQDSR